MTGPVRIDVEPSSLYVTHIFDGEEIVRGGEDGQVYVATFSSYSMAHFFVEQCKQIAGYVSGMQAKPSALLDEERALLERAIAALGEKQGVTFFKCTFDGDPPAPHKSWMDWCVSRMYTNVLIRAHEFGVPVTDALGEKEEK